MSKPIVSRRSFVQATGAMALTAASAAQVLGANDEVVLGIIGTGGRGTVIESIRTVAEAEFLKSKGASLWCVQADVEARYKRFIGKAMPQDAMTHEQFIEKDKQDMDASDPANQDLAAVCQMASTGLDNSGSKEELFAQVEEALKKI